MSNNITFYNIYFMYIHFIVFLIIGYQKTYLFIMIDKIIFKLR